MFLNIGLTAFAIAQHDYQFTRYTQEDGLISTSVTQLVKDKTGFLWLMSENGIMRFDGYDFKIYRHDAADSNSLPASGFYEMIRDDYGNFLIRGTNHLCKYFPSTNTFKKIISYSDSIRIFDWVPGSHSLVWATSTNHLLCIDAASENVLKYELPVSFDRAIMRLVTDSTKYAWLFNQKNQLLCFDMREKKFSPVSIRHLDFSDTGLKENPQIIFNNKSGIPCLLTSDGLYKYDRAKKTFFQFSRSSLNNKQKSFQGDPRKAGNYIFCGIANNDLLRVDIYDGSEKFYHLKVKEDTANDDFIFNGFYPSDDGSLWISTTAAGAFHFYPATETWDQLTNDPANQNSILSNSVDLIFEGKNNVVWLNSPGRGIVKAEPLKPILASYIPTVNKKSLQGTLAENTRAIAAFDKEQLLIGTLHGLFLFNTSSHAFTNLVSPVDNKLFLTTQAVSNIISDSSGNFWIADWGAPGIHLINYHKKMVAHLIPDPAKAQTFLTIRALFIDSHNFLWAGTDGNVIYRTSLRSFDESHPEKLVFEKINGALINNNALLFNKCFAIAENAGKNIYFATENGFYIFDYSTNEFKHFSNHLEQPESLSDNNIRSLCIDHSGMLWLGTANGGLNRFDGRNSSFSHFTMVDGLPDNAIYSILEDRKGFLWLGTNKGLCRFNPVNKSCRNYSLKDGIQNYEFNTNAAFKTADGDLAFGGRTGFNLFNPDSIELSSDAPPVVITSFKIFDREIPEKNELKLKYHLNSLSFQFAALSFFRNKENQYAYKLEGLDKDWIYCGDRRFTNYANLPPGEYNFRVKASNCFGVWNEAGASVKFLIDTAWWNTWWFRLALSLVITAFILIVFRLRLQQKLKLQSVRNRIARDLHDEIGSNLSSIILFSEVAKQKSTNTEPSIFPLLKKISDYTQTSQEAINDIVWMINSRNDRFENIIIRMRTLAAEMFEAKQINFNLTLDEKLNYLKLGMDERKNFYLIYKEAINNIVKYAACNNVSISLTYKNSSIYLQIIDDGIGFDLKDKSKGNGLLNMQKRAEMLNGKLTLHAERGKGTSLELVLKI